jgi:Putative phage serine protease XkdF
MSDEQINKWPSISDRPEPNTEQERPAFWPFTSDADVNDEGKVEKSVPLFFEKEKDEQIVYGIVYEPDTVDAQGDQASAEEIWKAAHLFMEKAQSFKVQHKGKPAGVKVLESYIAPQDLTIADRKVKKGSWIICAKVLDKDIWQAVKDGKLTGFSMAGYANRSE